MSGSASYEPVECLHQLGHQVLVQSVRDNIEVTIHSARGTFCVYRPRLAVNVVDDQIALGEPAVRQLFFHAAEIRVSSGVEVERRKSEKQIEKRQAEQIARQIAEWWRVAFEQFLLAESQTLMGIDNLGDFKVHSVDRFKNALHWEVKAALRTNPQIIPDWAAARVIKAWNIPKF
jgi:hypothetical protein